MSTVFVTTGATVAFVELISLVLDPEVLDALSDIGFTKLVVQYGKADEGHTLFTQMTEKLSGYTKIAIEGFPFSDNISSVISYADLVISHAGTGSILDTLRLRKKLIVMVNDKLMDNHQAEVADTLASDGYLLETTASREDLLKQIRQVPKFQNNPLPSPNKQVIETILHEL